MSQQLIEAITDMREDDALKITDQMLQSGTNPLDVLEACRQAMDIIGKRFEEGACFIPELIFAGEMLKEIAGKVKPLVQEQVGTTAKRGKVVFGTVQGDIHDIAKDIVVFMLDINGFEVTDLGVDVPPAKFVEATQETGATVVGLSGFLTLAYDPMKETVEALKAAGLDKVKVMIGGGQVDDQIRRYTGADAFGRDAMAAVSLAETMDRRLIAMFTKPENWNQLTPKEKMEARFNSWMSLNIEFASPEKAQAYKQRVQMIKDATYLQKPERIPIIPWWGVYPAEYGGITMQEAMYDYDKLGRAWKKFNADFENDGLVTCSLVGPGKVFDILDYKLYNWPGHGTPPNTSYQCVEGEYMTGDEYDLLITDPSGYFMRYYLPRIFGALTPWQMLAPFTDILELPFVGLGLIPTGIPPVQQAFKTFLEAGQAVMEWISAIGPIDGYSMATLGVPNIIGSFTKAPFDVLGDTMRGTRAIMLDMYRRPEKLIEAMERIVPIAVEMGVRYATVSDTPMVFIPLHKGADGFMSNKDFEKFYWPTLKGVLLGLINEGTVPYLFVEGGYNQRLDIITDPDIPAGHTIWMFDHTDMKEVKKKLGGWACFGGNVPGSLLKAGKPQEIENYVKELIDGVAQDGGYILANGAVLDNTTPENLHAMLDTGKKYGVYK